jgi:excisionase family DNA binding protein
MSLIDERALRDLIAAEVRKVVREEIARGSGATAGDDYLAVKDAARIASVATDTIRDWIKNGSLGRYHAGRVLRVKRSELHELLARPPALGATDTPEAAARAYLRRASRPA